MPSRKRPSSTRRRAARRPRNPAGRDTVMQLQDFAQVVRSKNAGPRRLTLDLIFRNDADYQRAAQAYALTPERLAPRYGVRAGARSRSSYHAESCPATPATATSTARSSTPRCWSWKYAVMAFEDVLDAKRVLGVLGRRRLRAHARSVRQIEGRGADADSRRLRATGLWRSDPGVLG